MPERVLVALVAVVLLVGIGTLGWLVAHVATYDALGHAGAHAGHAYMQPTEQSGSGTSIMGIVTAAIAVLLASASAIRWVGALLHTRTALALALAAPTATFIAVELHQGPDTGAGSEVLALGVPMQLLLGWCMLVIVRRVFDAMAYVAAALEAVGEPLCPVTSPAAPCPAGYVPLLRRSSMATGAPRRGPPPRMP